MIKCVVVVDYKDGMPLGENTFTVDYGIDVDRGVIIPLPKVDPRVLGAVYSYEFDGYVLEE